MKPLGRKIHDGIRPERIARIRGLLTDSTEEVVGVVTSIHSTRSGDILLEIDLETATAAAERITAEAGTDQSKLARCCEAHVTQPGVLSPTVCRGCGSTLMVRDHEWQAGLLDSGSGEGLGC